MPLNFNQFLSTTYLGNTGKAYLIALGVFIALFIIFKIFDSVVISFLRRVAKKTKADWDDIIIDFMSAISWQFYAFLAFFISTITLQVHPILERALQILLVIFLAFYASRGFSKIVDHFTDKQIEKRKKQDKLASTSMIKTFGIIFKIAIYSIAFLMILDNFGIEITPLIASLGVGGIAIAIALQSVLSDLFSAFAIYFDKPFKEGDFIIVGDDLGTVKRIGIKTTRIQTLQGQELVMSNTELTNTRVNNYSKMQRRRVVTQIGVEYSTPLNKMKKINGIVKKAVDSTKDATLDRTHFKGYGDFSLNYEIVYYIESPDYNKYMDIQQEINFKIKEAFEKEKIVFAFPTQTLHIGSFKKK